MNKVRYEMFPIDDYDGLYYDIYFKNGEQERYVASVPNLQRATDILEELNTLDSNIQDLERAVEYCEDNH